MGTVASIIAALTAIFVGLPKILGYLNDWFAKSTTEKVQEAQKKVDDEIADFKKLRPRK